MSLTDRTKNILRSMNEGYLPSLKFRNKLVKVINNNYTDKELENVIKLGTEMGYFDENGDIPQNDGYLWVVGKVLEKKELPDGKVQMLVDGEFTL